MTNTFYEKVNRKNCSSEDTCETALKLLDDECDTGDVPANTGGVLDMTELFLNREFPSEMKFHF